MKSEGGLDGPVKGPSQSCPQHSFLYNVHKHADHFPVFCRLLLKNLPVHQKQPAPAPIQTKRIFSTENCATFANLLVDTDWSDVIESTQVDNALEAFDTKLLDLYDTAFPAVQVRTQTKAAKSWHSDKLIILQKEVDRVGRKYFLNKSCERWKIISYYALLNFYRAERKREFQVYHIKRIDDATKRPGVFWKYVRQRANWSPSHQQSSSIHCYG